MIRSKDVRKKVREIDVETKSVRLDKYYSFSPCVDKFGKAKVYVIPRKNATMKGSFEWKRIMMMFVKDTSLIWRNTI